MQPWIELHSVPPSIREHLTVMRAPEVSAYTAERGSEAFDAAIAHAETEIAEIRAAEARLLMLRSILSVCPSWWNRWRMESCRRKMLVKFLVRMCCYGSANACWNSAARRKHRFPAQHSERNELVTSLDGAPSTARTPVRGTVLMRTLFWKC